jgi:O-antigen ligase
MVAQKNLGGSRPRAARENGMPPLVMSNRRRTAAPVHVDRGRQPAPYALGFALFLVMNAALFVRPSEITPGLQTVEIYIYCILSCLAVSFPVVLEQLMPQSLERQPITVCVLGLLPAIILSHLSHFRLEAAVLFGWEFFKFVLYFLLLVGLICTPERLRVFLRCFMLFSAVVAALAVLQYHELIKLPNLNPVKENYRNAATGQEGHILRLQGSGIFQDPNDLCILLVVSIILSMYWLTDLRWGLFRLLMLGPLLLFAYALSRTQSRGGMLALLGGMGLFMRLRYGWLRSLLLGLVVVPLLFILFAGRQTSISTTDGTAQERIQIWREGVMLFRQAPLFGIGADEYNKEVGRAAHNSYLHTYTELGAFGGFLFVGAYALALTSLYRLGTGGRRILDPELRRLYPYLFGMIAAYAIGMISLTLCYIIPTYTMLGLAIVYRRMTVTSPALPPPRCDARLVMQLAALNAVVFVGFNLFIRFFVIG